MKPEKYYKLCIKLCEMQGGVKDESKCSSCPLRTLHCGFYFDCEDYLEIQTTVKKVKRVLKTVFPYHFRKNNPYNFRRK